ncbi:MAG: Ig-like domain repeat protein [Saprospiraceae bacterium]|nr:Ig-like domain repeat protein [Saprospiraceae bacterium]
MNLKVNFPINIFLLIIFSVITCNLSFSIGTSYNPANIGGDCYLEKYNFLPLNQYIFERDSKISKSMIDKNRRNFTILDLMAIPTTTTLTSSLNPSNEGNTVTFTSTTLDISSFPATSGNVTFKEGLITLAGPIAVNINGQASFTINNLTEGAHTITADFDNSSILYFASSGTVIQTVQAFSASLRDSLLLDNNSNMMANPNDQLRYFTTIRNRSMQDKDGVNFNLAAPVNTTLNPGSTVTSALARDDAFNTFINTSLSTGNLLTNDFGMPSVNVVSFGTTASLGITTIAGSAGTTDQGGLLTVNANGTFSYDPPPAFSGTDLFAYIATTGVADLPNNDAVVTITVYPDILFSTTPVNPNCNGASTGSISFTGVGGGSGPIYTFSITGAGGTFQGSNVFNGLAAGMYTPAVKDGAGNIKTAAAINLTDPPIITFTTTDVNNTCAGASAGSITFNASGGTGSLMYSITGSGGTYQPSNVFTSLIGGTYNLAVKDANGCIVTGSAMLTDPLPVSFSFTKTDITCFGAANGSIIFNAPSGGTGPYTYSITGTGGPFTGSTSYTGLAANTYNLVVKDATGCNSTTQSTMVAEPTAIVVSGTIPNLTYNVAMATAVFNKTGGVGSPANPWSATGLPTGVSINTANGQVSGTPTVTGIFNATITYTDANSCTGFKMVAFNVAPNLANNSYNVEGNTQLVSNGHSSPSTPFTADATNILTNDQADVAITVTAVTNAATTGGGTITIDAAGKFIYSPPVGSTAADSYVYTGTANGVSSTATINFSIANMVWFVNNTYAGGNGMANGTSHRPYTDVASAEAASLINQIIYVHTGAGNTTGNALLKSGQTLRGAGSALNVGALSIAAGTKPTLSGMITLANSVTVDGFDMSTGATTALVSNGATSVAVNIGNVTSSGASKVVNLANTSGIVTIAGGTQTNSTDSTIIVNGGSVSLTYGGGISQSNNVPIVSIIGGHTSGMITFNTGTLNATNGSGLQFNNADGTYNFNGTTTLNGGDAGIDILNGSSGTFVFGSGITISRANSVSGEAFNLLSSDANVTFSGSMTLGTSTGNMIAINNHDAGIITFQTGNLTKGSSTTQGINITNSNGGSINFNNPTIAITMTSGNAISLTNNSGGTMNFTPSAGGNGVDLTTTSGIGLNVTGGGTINVTGTGNTISSTTGTALNVANTTIGASNLNFQSISANGAPNGIVLNTTGSSGSLIVTGTGSANTGGTIQNSVTHGIVMTSTMSPTLSFMNINDNAGVATDDGMQLTNITGTVTFTSLSISGAPHNGITFDNFDTNLTAFIMSNSSIACPSGFTCQTGGTTGNDGVLIVMRGSSVLTNGLISGSTFSGMRAVAVQVQANDNARIGLASGGVITAPEASNSFTIQNNTFIGNGIGIDMDISQVGSMAFQILSNSIVAKLTSPGAIPNQTSSHAINAFTAAGASTGPASHFFVGKIDGNTIGTQGVKDSGSGIGSGIRVVVQGQNTQGAVTVINNTVREVPNSTILNFIGQNGNATTGTNTARFKIINNTMPAPSGSNLSLCGPANTPCAEFGIFVLADEGTPVCNIITGNSIYDLTTVSGGVADIYLAERAGPPAGAQLTVEGTGGSNSAYIIANNTLAGATKFIDEGANTSQVGAGVCGSFPSIVAPPVITTDRLNNGPVIEIQKSGKVFGLKNVIPIKKVEDTRISKSSKKK